MENHYPVSLPPSQTHRQHTKRYSLMAPKARKKRRCSFCSQWSLMPTCGRLREEVNSAFGHLLLSSELLLTFPSGSHASSKATHLASQPPGVENEEFLWTCRHEEKVKRSKMPQVKQNWARLPRVTLTLGRTRSGTQGPAALRGQRPGLRSRPHSGSGQAGRPEQRWRPRSPSPGWPLGGGGWRWPEPMAAPRPSGTARPCPGRGPGPAASPRRQRRMRGRGGSRGSGRAPDSNRRFGGRGEKRGKETARGEWSGAEEGGGESGRGVWKGSVAESEGRRQKPGKEARRTARAGRGVRGRTGLWDLGFGHPRPQRGAPARLVLPPALPSAGTMVDRGPLLTSAIIFYLSIGAAIFEVLEEPHWRSATDNYKRQKTELLKQFPCLGQEGLDRILQVRWAGRGRAGGAGSSSSSSRCSGPWSGKPRGPGRAGGLRNRRDRPCLRPHKARGRKTAPRAGA